MSFYKIKVWLTTLIAAPFLILLTGLPDLAEFSDSLPVLVTIISFSFIFALPLIVAFALTHMLLKRFNQGRIEIKIALSIVSLTGIFTYVYFATGQIFSTPSHIYTLSYSGSMLFSIWFYRLDEFSNEDESQIE